MNPARTYKRQRSLALLPRTDDSRSTEEYRGKSRAFIRRVEVFFDHPEPRLKARSKLNLTDKSLWWPWLSTGLRQNTALKALSRTHVPSLSSVFKPVFVSGQHVAQKVRTNTLSGGVNRHKRQVSDTVLLQRDTRCKRVEIPRKPPCNVSLEGLLDSWTGIINGD